MEKIGIIKSISIKNDSKWAFCLTDSPQWYNGYGSPEVKKGDKITFTLEINGNFHNFSDVVKMPVVEEEHVADSPENRQIDERNAMSPKERSIVAQCLTKCVWYGSSDATVDKVLETYNEFLNRL